KYYNASNVEINEIIFYTTNANTAYNMYINDELDFLTSIGRDKFDEARLRDDYYSHPYNAASYLSFNTTVKPLDNPKIREALTLAIDRESLNKIILKNQSDPTRNLTPPFENYSYGKELILFDPERAKQLLTEAGYPNGKDFPTLKYKISKQDGMGITAEFLQEQFKKILNINLEIESEEWTTFLNSRKMGNYQISDMGWSGDYLDPLTFLESLFITENHTFGAFGYSNKEYDSLIKQSDLEQDPIKRQDILRKAEEIIIEKDFPVAPITIPKSYYLFRNDRWKTFSTSTEIAYLKELKPTKKLSKI
ncbi:peptide ABC transporter substrate-binding protein, partial [Borrelia sp. A-FGy1]|uniref:peptide ABC transporter substrate-binding protein n=1 Tax=Borrelia sp. A-FGy1 TaxID=2608247 RepID=UPI0015F45005